MKPSSKCYLVSALIAATFAAPAASETLTILHTNDFHSRVEPISKYNSGCKPEDNEAGKCFGGYARLANAIRAAREDTNNSILVDGGDQFQGSLFYTYYKGKVAAEMMNRLGYDGMTVGNHEFDDGPEILREFIDTVSFPVLMSNADYSKERFLNNVLKPSVVIERGGEEIGLIGLTPEDTADLASPGKKVTFSDPVEAVTREVKKLTDAGVKRIIVLSHSGYQTDLIVASDVDGIDVIVGGHSNTFLSNTDPKATGPYPTWIKNPNGGKTAIVQAYAYGKYLGRLDVTFDDDGVVTSAVGEPVIVDGQISEDTALKERIAELAQPLEDIRQKKVAEAAAPIDGDRANCRAQECQMGNLVSEALLARVKDQGVSIAVYNGGGLRASIDGGEITMGEVLTVLPFQNVVSTFQLTGADIVAALESGVSQIEEGKGRFPQVAGLRYALDPSVPANSGRVSDVEVRTGETWAPIDLAKRYGVVSNDFLRSGGDGYKIFEEKAENAYDFGPSVEDVVAEYLSENSPYSPVLDGRITLK